MKANLTGVAPLRYRERNREWGSARADMQRDKENADIACWLWALLRCRMQAAICVHCEDWTVQIYAVLRSLTDLDFV